MGPILAILSYVTRTYTKLISLMQKTTNPSYNADTDSNEAISNAVTNVNSYVTEINSISTSIRNNTFTANRSEDLRTLTSTDSIVYEKLSTKPFIFQGGIIDLSPLQSGDRIYVTLMSKIVSAGYCTVGELKIIGPLPSTNSKLTFSPMYSQYGVRVVMSQYAGTYRQIRSEWYDTVQLG